VELTKNLYLARLDEKGRVGFPMLSMMVPRTSIEYHPATHMALLVLVYSTRRPNVLVKYRLHCLIETQYPSTHVFRYSRWDRQRGKRERVQLQVLCYKRELLVSAALLIDTRLM